MTRGHMLKKRYGITQEQYLVMLAEQDGKCAICGREESALSRSGKIKPLAVDHCHTTGKVRKLLCFNCNNGLGDFNDNVVSLARAIAYVKEHSDVSVV